MLCIGGSLPAFPDFCTADSAANQPLPYCQKSAKPVKVLPIFIFHPKMRAVIKSTKRL